MTIKEIIDKKKKVKSFIPTVGATEEQTRTEKENWLKKNEEITNHNALIDIEIENFLNSQKKEDDKKEKDRIQLLDDKLTKMNELFERNEKEKEEQKKANKKIQARNKLKSNFVKDESFELILSQIDLNKIDESILELKTKFPTHFINSSTPSTTKNVSDPIKKEDPTTTKKEEETKKENEEEITFEEFIKKTKEWKKNFLKDNGKEPSKNEEYYFAQKFNIK